MLKVKRGQTDLNVKSKAEIEEIVLDNIHIATLMKEDGLNFTEACEEIGLKANTKKIHVAKYGFDVNNPKPLEPSGKAKKRDYSKLISKKENTTSAANTDGEELETPIKQHLNHIIQNNKIASIFDEAKENFNNKKFDREKLMAQMLHIAMQIAVCDELTGGGNDEKYN